jgi:hypothetical protein
MLPARSKRYVGSDGRIPREHTLTLLELVVGLMTLIALLVLMFPRDSLMQRLFKADVDDPLTVAYTLNMLKVEPNNPQLKGLQLRQKLKSLSWQELRDETQEMLASGSIQEKHVAASILLMKIAQSEQKTPEMINLSRELLRFGLESGWQPQELQPMIERAFALSELELAQKMLKAWWALKPSAPWVWLEGLAAAELSQGRYGQSALISFNAREFSQDRVAQKRYFMQGLATLMSGGLYQDAMDAADRYVGDLISDEQVLRHLVKNAQAAGQPKRANRYARLLLEMK